MAVILSLLLLATVAGAEVALDTTFGVNGITWTAFGESNNSDDPRDLLIQPDGRILTAGISTAYSGQWYIAMSRHSADGVIDSGGFGDAGKIYHRFAFRDFANAIDLQDDGKIVVVGMQMTSTGVSTQTPSVYRFRADGTVDTTFGNGGYVAVKYGGVSSGELTDVRVHPGGSIHAGGRCNPNINGGISGFGWRRYLSDGTIAAGGVLQFLITAHRGSCAFPDDGGILLANIAPRNGRYEFVMARLDNLGNPVAGFGANGVVETGVEAVLYTDSRVQLQSDGKILLVGTTPGDLDGYNFTALRFHPDGTADSSFGVLGRADVSLGWNDYCRDAAIDGDGKILLAGQASVASWWEPGFARLLPNGDLDPTFSGDGKFTINLNGGGGSHHFTRVLILPDGRVLAAGSDSGSNSGDFFLARFHPSGPTGIDDVETPPSGMTISTAPNPGHGVTAVSLQLPGERRVTVEIFDATGRMIRRLFVGTLSPGAHVIPWDGRDEAGQNPSAGVYFARASTRDERQIAKLIRVR